MSDWWATYYNAHADEYERLSQDKLHFQKELIFPAFIELLSQINSPKKILDLWAWNWLSTQVLINHFSDSVIHALDNSHDMLDYCRTNTWNKCRKYILADMQKNHYGKNRYDLISSIMSLHYLSEEEIHLLLQKLNVSLTKQGKIIIAGLHPLYSSGKITSDWFISQNYLSQSTYQTDFLDTNNPINIYHHTPSTISQLVSSHRLYIEKIIEPQVSPNTDFGKAFCEKYWDIPGTILYQITK